MKFFSLIMAASASVASVASAGVIPPPWTSGAFGTPIDASSPQTQQLWTFDNQSAPTAPDFSNNPNGTPQLSPDGSTYIPHNPYGPSGNGGWMVGEPTSLDFLIPNFNQLFRKEIWVVIKFQMPSQGAGVPTIDILGLDGSPGTPVGPISTPGPVDGQPGLLEVAFWYQMPTCWTFHLGIHVPVGIPGSATYIDQVYVATRCIIPAPSGMALIGIASLIAGRRRR